MISVIELLVKFMVKVQGILAALRLLLTDSQLAYLSWVFQRSFYLNGTQKI